MIPNNSMKISGETERQAWYPIQCQQAYDSMALVVAPSSTSAQEILKADSESPASKSQEIDHWPNYPASRAGVELFKCHTKTVIIPFMDLRLRIATILERTN